MQLIQRNFSINAVVTKHVSAFINFVNGRIFEENFNIPLPACMMSSLKMNVANLWQEG